jgi:hypothetical protein
VGGAVGCQVNDGLKQEIEMLADRCALQVMGNSAGLLLLHLLRIAVAAGGAGTSAA